jgi:PRTRC genetic system protein A
MLLTCLHCGQVGESMSIIPLKEKRLVHLECGHVCTYDITQMSEGMTMKNRPLGLIVPCRGCSVKYMPLVEGPLKEFCPVCRADFGLKTDEDAVELLSMMENGGVQLSDRRGRGRVDKSHEPVGQGVVAPKVDPAVVAEGLRQLVDYKVSPITTFDKPITYIMFKNGLFEVRHSDLATIITQPKEVIGLTEEAKEGVTFNLPKIPMALLMQTISFFRGVCQRQNASSEALVQIWWDRQEKQHVLHVPEQHASGGGVHPTSCFDQDVSGRWFRVGDIHSHGTTMGAFFSGTDDEDEKKVTTERVFGVIGKVAQPIPEWQWRMRTRGGFIPLDIADIFTMPQEQYTFTIDAMSLFRSINKPDTFKNGQVILSCPVDPFKDVAVPEEWYAQVTKQVWQGKSGEGHCWNRGESAMVKGFIYISNLEYQVDGQTLTPTGRKLTTQKDHGKVSA